MLADVGWIERRINANLSLTYVRTGRESHRAFQRAVLVVGLMFRQWPNQGYGLLQLAMERVMALARAEIEKLRQENHQLKEENKSLRHQLKQMRGKIFKPRVKPGHDGKEPKRGAPGGHRGNSRRRPEVISEFINFYPEKCNRCGGKVNGYENHFDEHVTEDIEIKKRVICRRFHYGYCQRCKKVVYARKDEMPARDRIGTEVRAISGYMRHLGLTYRKAVRFLKHVFDIDLTHPSLLSFNTEQAQNGAPLYEGIKQSIRHSPSVNADET